MTKHTYEEEELFSMGKWLNFMNCSICSDLACDCADRCENCGSLLAIVSGLDYCTTCDDYKEE